MSVQEILKKTIKKAINPLGIDIVKYDSSRKSQISTYKKNKFDKPENLIIGGGDRNYGPHWHNIEYVTEGFSDKYKTLRNNTDISYDLTSLAPFFIESSSIKGIYSSHVIEHLKDEHVCFLFKEAYRMLKPGGYLRLSCPDANLYVRAFLEKDIDFFHYRNHPHYLNLDIQDSIEGLFLDVFATKLNEKKEKYSYESIDSKIKKVGMEEALNYYCSQVEYDYKHSCYHVNWFTIEKLTKFLNGAGFNDVYRSAIGQSYCSQMRDLTMFDLGDSKISLFIECKK